MQYATSYRTLLLALGLPATVLLALVHWCCLHWCYQYLCCYYKYTGARNPKETLSTRNYTIHDKDDRDVRNKHFVYLLHNFKGIYAVLSRIWKCRKSRVFGANFPGQKCCRCYICRFFQLCNKAFAKGFGSKWWVWGKRRCWHYWPVLSDHREVLILHYFCWRHSV